MSQWKFDFGATAGVYVGFATEGKGLIRWVYDKRRDRTIERFGHAAQNFGLAFLNHSISADNAHAGFQQVLLDLRHSERESIERRVDLLRARCR